MLVLPQPHLESPSFFAWIILDSSSVFVLGLGFCVLAGFFNARLVQFFPGPCFLPCSGLTWAESMPKDGPVARIQALIAAQGADELPSQGGVYCKSHNAAAGNENQQGLGLRFSCGKKSKTIGRME